MANQSLLWVCLGLAYSVCYAELFVIHKQVFNSSMANTSPRPDISTVPETTSNPELVILLQEFGPYKLEHEDQLQHNRAVWKHAHNGTLYNNGSLENLEQTCQHALTIFAYKKNLCGTVDAESFMETGKSVYSCQNRCGQKPGHMFRGLRECACDVTCLVFNDCCLDMPRLCPVSYSRAREKTSNLTGAIPSCQALTSTWVLVPDSSNTAEDSFHSTTFPTQPTSGSTEPEFSVSGLDLQLLKDYTFQVADARHGVVFQNLAKYRIFNGPGLGNARIVPIWVSLECPPNVLAWPGLVYAADTLRFCGLAGVESIKTPFHRSCESGETVMCMCGNGHQVKDKLEDTCQGDHHVVRLFSRTRIEWEHAKFENWCTQSSNWAYFNEEPRKVHLRFLVSPVLITPTSDTAATGSTSKSTAENKIDTKSRFAAQLNPYKSIRFVIEFEDRLEKRFVCSKYHSSLAKCKLLECSKGCLVIHDPGSSRAIGGQLCIAPTQVTVTSFVPSRLQATSFVPDRFQATSLNIKPTISLCLCMRLQVALTSLKLWTVSSRFFTVSCSFWLRGIPKGRDITPRDSPSSSFLYPELLLSTNLNELDWMVKTLTHHLHTTSYVCPPEHSKILHLCFWYGEGAEEKECIKILDSMARNEMSFQGKSVSYGFCGLAEGCWQTWPIFPEPLLTCLFTLVICSWLGR